MSVGIGNEGAVAVFVLPGVSVSGWLKPPSTMAIDFNCLRSSGGRFFAISSKEAWGVGWTNTFSFVSCFPSVLGPPEPL